MPEHLRPLPGNNTTNPLTSIPFVVSGSEGLMSGLHFNVLAVQCVAVVDYLVAVVIF